MELSYQTDSLCSDDTVEHYINSLQRTQSEFGRVMRVFFWGISFRIGSRLLIFQSDNMPCSL